MAIAQNKSVIIGDSPLSKTIIICFIPPKSFRCLYLVNTGYLKYLAFSYFSNISASIIFKTCDNYGSNFDVSGPEEKNNSKKSNIFTYVIPYIKRITNYNFTFKIDCFVLINNSLKKGA